MAFNQHNIVWLAVGSQRGVRKFKWLITSRRLLQMRGDQAPNMIKYFIELNSSRLPKWDILRIDKRYKE